jgi:hypothetical protein
MYGLKRFLVPFILATAAMPVCAVALAAPCYPGGCCQQAIVVPSVVYAPTTSMPNAAWPWSPAPKPAPVVVPVVPVCTPAAPACGPCDACQYAEQEQFARLAFQEGQPVRNVARGTLRIIGGTVRVVARVVTLPPRLLFRR